MIQMMRIVATEDILNFVAKGEYFINLIQTWPTGWQ